MTTARTSPTAVAAAESNTLGLVGFIISLVGLLSAGILCPIGLIISLVALGRQPKGFAIAGVVLGALGTCGGIIAIFVFGAAILVALGVLAVALTNEDATELTIDMIQLAVRVAEHRDEHGSLPESLADLDVDPEALVDPWGNDYVYLLTSAGRGFDLLSPGADGVRGSEDDVVLSRLGRAWRIGGTVKITSSADGGNVRVTIGDRSVDIEATEPGGNVSLDLGDKVLRIEGGDAGGTVAVVGEPAAPAQPEPPAEPEP